MSDHLKRIQKQVDEMNKVFDMRPDEELQPTQAPATDPPRDAETDPPSTNPPRGNETDPPKTDAPKTQPPSTDPPDDKDAIIAALREKLADKDEPPKTKAPSTKPPTTDAPPQEIDFIGELDLEDLSDNKEELNKVFNKVMQEAIKTGRSSQPDFMAAIPTLVSSITALQKATEDFYEANPDLKSFKKVVGTTFEELAEKNPDKKYNELINDVAPLVRQKLELPDPKKKKAKETPPRLPRKKSVAGRTPDNQEPDSTQSQIEEMNKSLGR
jgi:hypothetical protein